LKVFWQWIRTCPTVSAEGVGHDVVEIGRAELILADGRKVPIKYVVHRKLEEKCLEVEYGYLEHESVIAR
jgi:hypothetical protein